MCRLDCAHADVEGFLHRAVVGYSVFGWAGAMWRFLGTATGGTRETVLLKNM